MITFYCHKCGKKSEFEKKKDMYCDCGKYINKRVTTGDFINMRNTWSGTTKVEFSQTTMEQDIKSRGGTW